MVGLFTPYCTRAYGTLRVYTLSRRDRLHYQYYISPSFTRLQYTKSTITQSQMTILETLRDRILSELKLGKQAPGYKTALKALNHFITLKSRLAELLEKYC